MLITPQASRKQYKPRSREKHNKNRGAQCVVASTGSVQTSLFTYSYPNCCEISVLQLYSFFPAHSQLIPAISWTNSNYCFHYQVVAVQEEASRLQGSYAGDKAREIQDKEDEVLDAWKRLNWRVKQRTERLHDADDLYRFLLAVQDQMLWMNDMLKQILTYEKAKWVFPP